uniref:Chromosome partition protein Smc n=1 Tax=uncultured marine group II/III euryarchaeote KM3_156_A06 TaxID=1457899 RepID=A0A075GKS8_9EURY|nr:Chromosome segregation ATPase (smc) [uncultured marine group II/III euryarchaeote KM3_156_A06]
MGYLHLKAIEMENFKSFKGEVVIPFEVGFTGITGPNGSGKSNCGDALQFVLGAKSSKSLRAENVGQLIFNGGNRGKAAKNCKVTLIFDNPKDSNGNRRLKVDTDEVLLTRTVRLGRKGNSNSAYYLNERPSTATEFRRLLTGAGARGDGYNIVLQGDVTHLATMTDRARRKVLEDVAGVTSYDDEIRKANRQRDKVEQYLEQITLLEDEINKRIKTLAKEREQAMKYRELQETLETARRTLMHSRHRSRLEEIELVTDERGNYIVRLSEIGEEIEADNKQELSIEDELAEIQRQLNEVLGDDGKKLGDQQRRLEVEVETRKDRISGLKEDIDDASDEQEVLLAEQVEAEQALASHEESLDSARDTLKKAEEDLQGAAEVEEDARSALDSGDKVVHELNRAFGKATESVEKTQEVANKAILKVGAETQNVEFLHQQLADLETALDEARLNRDDLLLQGEELDSNAPEQDRTKLAQELAKIQRQERGLLDDVQRSEEQLRDAEMALVRARGELENRSGSTAGMARAVKAVLNLRDSGEVRGILGSMSELCAPKDSRDEEALAYAMGGGMNSIVVRDDETAAQCISWLRKNKAGRATFLPLNRLQSRRPGGRSVMVSRQPGVVGFASDLLEYDNSIELAVINVVRDTLIVESMDVARRHMGGVRMVTRTGSVVEGSGAMVGGSARANRPQFGGKMAGSSVVEKAEEDVERLSLVAETGRAALAELRQSEHQLRQRINNLANDDHAFEARAWKEDLGRAETSFKDSESKVKVALKNLEQATAKQNKAESASELANNAHQDALQAKTDSATALQEGSPQHLSRRLRDSQEQRNEAERAKLTAKGTLSGGENQSILLTNQIKELQRRIDEQQSIVDKATKKISDAESEIETYQEELDTVSEAHSQITEEYRELDDKRIALREERVKLTTRLEQKVRDRDAINKRITDLNLQIHQKKEALRELDAEMAELEIKPASDDAVLPTVQEAEASVRNLERRVGNLGDVNMRAIEQYDEAQERSGNLSTDSKRLREHRQSLISLEDQLESERKDRLTTVMDIVNVNFSRVYQHLQPGGKGELRFENPKKPFEGGLQMWASPPGKKSGLGLLSGGEKSMAALALIFAIQDYEPSPFYYFDEVDQNLDTFNAENIASLCRLRSEQAQFIMVTLRKVSLQLADHHIGITHAGDGCSRRITDFGRDQAIEVGDAAHQELEAMKKTKDAKKALDELPAVEEMPKAPEELATPASLGGLDIEDLLAANKESELKAEAEVAEEAEDGDTLSSLADRAEDFREDMEEKLEVALPIEQEQRDILDARDAEEEVDDLDIDGITKEEEGE